MTISLSMLHLMENIKPGLIHQKAREDVFFGGKMVFLMANLRLVLYHSITLIYLKFVD